MKRIVILLVDDEKTVLDSLSEQLRRLYREGVDCETAESAEEAWELIHELHDESIDILVVVSDWLMPGQRGDEFLAQVRSLYPQIGRIMLTGQADPVALERARIQAAAHRILFKPWQPEQLREAIESSVQSKGRGDP